MSQVNVIRARKDEEYRQSLSAGELALPPDNPAGAIELTDGEMLAVEGGEVLLLIAVFLSGVVVGYVVADLLSNNA
jgi:mersacidin/lichenicidin family type 2 lantibiotic